MWFVRHRVYLLLWLHNIHNNLTILTSLTTRREKTFTLKGNPAVLSNVQLLDEREREITLFQYHRDMKRRTVFSI